MKLLTKDTIYQIYFNQKGVKLMKIKVKEIKSGEDSMNIFANAYQMGVEAARKAWGE